MHYHNIIVFLVLPIVYTMILNHLQDYILDAGVVCKRIYKSTGWHSHMLCSLIFVCGQSLDQNVLLLQCIDLMIADIIA